MTRQADAAWPSRGPAVAARDEVIAGLLRLVTVDEQGRPTRWRVAGDRAAGSGRRAGPFVGAADC